MGRVAVLSTGAPIRMTSRFLPAGNYAITAKTNIYDGDHEALTFCVLWGGTTILDASSIETLGIGLGDSARYGTVALVGTVAFAQGGTVELTCATDRRRRRQLRTPRSSPSRSAP